MVKIAVLQMQSGIDPMQNTETITAACREAKAGGAVMLFTPEMAGLLDKDRKRAALSITTQDDDKCLKMVQEQARESGLWVALGSLAVRLPNGALANRSLVIDGHGAISATYDKMHMFDVDLANGESWRESNAYQAGDEVVTAETPIGKLGLSICYDMRFPALFSALGDAACDVIAIPAAFTKPTGAAHWHVLQRARAIEASAYVVAAAQVGKHEDGRETYGHSLVVDPWGEVLLDLGGEQPGLGFADISQERIAAVRRQVPSLANRRKIAN